MGESWSGLEWHFSDGTDLTGTRKLGDVGSSYSAKRIFILFDKKKKFIRLDSYLFITFVLIE